MGDHAFEQCTVALAESIETAFEPLLETDEDVPRKLHVLVRLLRHGDSS